MNSIKRIIQLFVVLLFSFYSLKAQEVKKETFKSTLKMEGRIMYDFNFLSAGDDNFSGNEFRRVRLAAKGKATKNIDYKVEFDFAGGAVNFRDVYLKFKFPSNIGNLMLGSFTEPSSLNNMTSSKYITFFERSMLSNTQPFKYNAGFMYDNQKLLDGKIGLQLAYSFNGYNNAGDAFKDKDISGGANFIARLTGAVLKNKEKNQVVHLGVNYEYRDNNSDLYYYSFRTENHMGDKTSVGTQYLKDDELKTPTIFTSGVFENTSDIGFELATTYGSLSLQGEYEISSIVTDIDTYKTNAYYAFASFFILGNTDLIKTVVLVVLNQKLISVLKKKHLVL